MTIVAVMKNFDLKGPIIALAPLLILIALVGFITGGHFIYTLDDPYIHLALAKEISGFHYGINASEFSAPSSSILWPFLMAPFAGLQGFMLAPLAVNSACLIGTLLVLQRLFSLHFRLSQYSSWALTAILAFCLNIYGLVFTGMEHSLQVFLAAIIASSLVRRKLDLLLWVSLFVLPLVRYEGLAISVPVLFYLAFQDHAARAKAILTGLLLAVALVSFSAFLASLGLGYLPSSVFAKQSATTSGSAFSLFRSIAGTAFTNINSFPTFTVYAIALLSGFYSFSMGWHRVLILLGAPAILHLSLGQSGWFGRYEVSILLYLLIISGDLFAQKLRSHSDPVMASSVGQSGRSGRLVKGEALFPLLMIFVVGTRPLWQSTFLTPLAARNIQDQQAQMALIVSNYLRKPVAVNDLGLVSLSSNMYVLDLWGLGSYEALSLRRSNNDPRLWIRRLMTKKDVEHAIVYDTAFPVIPDNWIKVAQLKLPGRRVTPASDVVSFYATSPASAEDLVQAISQYKSEYPGKSAMVHFLHSATGG